MHIKPWNELITLEYSTPNNQCDLYFVSAIDIFLIHDNHTAYTCALCMHACIKLHINDIMEVIIGRVGFKLYQILLLTTSIFFVTFVNALYHCSIDAVCSDYNNMCRARIRNNEESESPSTDDFIPW